MPARTRLWSSASNTRISFITDNLPTAWRGRRAGLAKMQSVRQFGLDSRPSAVNRPDPQRSAQQRRSFVHTGQAKRMPPTRVLQAALDVESVAIVLDAQKQTRRLRTNN